mmetsp:Transcript_7776/g.11524  ORF Transcript_7776/g.11524 Transcript_7776/m.11524 type:complete len:92 (-) Transcript_7776:78-353(-)
MATWSLILEFKDLPSPVHEAAIPFATLTSVDMLPVPDIPSPIFDFCSKRKSALSSNLQFPHAQTAPRRVLPQQTSQAKIRLGHPQAKRARA